MNAPDEASDGRRFKCLSEKRNIEKVLVLTRKTNQSIVIGDGIEITILSVSGDKVRVGIDAPRDVEVFRKEVKAGKSSPAAAGAHSAGGTADG